MIRSPAALVLAFLVTACAEPAAPPSPEVPPHATAAASVVLPANALLRRAEPSTVCMMNNRFMEVEQIPVVVEGRTYFGCCAMCKDKLQNDATARTGTDPVSGKPVDKSTAIIGVKRNGNVLYFESETTFAAYSGTEAPALPPTPPASGSPAAAASPGPAPTTSASTPPSPGSAPRPSPAPAAASPKAPGGGAASSLPKAPASPAASAAQPGHMGH